VRRRKGHSRVRNGVGSSFRHAALHLAQVAGAFPSFGKILIGPWLVGVRSMIHGNGALQKPLVPTIGSSRETLDGLDIPHGAADQTPHFVFAGPGFGRKIGTMVVPGYSLAQGLE